MISEEKKTHTVTDMDLAAVLWMKGFKFVEVKIEHVEVNDKGTMVWIFDNSDGKITDVCLKYKNQELSLEPMELFHKRRSLVEEAQRMQRLDKNGTLKKNT